MGDEPLPQVSDGPPVGAEPTDAELAIRAPHDPAAFQLIYDRHFDAVFRFCYYRCGDWAEAEDLTHDVFLRAFRGLPHFRAGTHEESVRAWIFTIARRETANHWRYRSRHPSDPLTAADFVAASGPTPEEAALALDDHRLLWNLIAQLKPAQRSLLELRLAGLKDVEIARELQRSHDAIRAEQSRIIKRLRAMWRKMEGASA